MAIFLVIQKVAGLVHAPNSLKLESIGRLWLEFQAAV